MRTCLALGTRLGLALLAFVPLLAAAQGKPQPTKPAERYERRQRHDSDGIGKFYMGREIAQVMGHLGAGWLERPERDREEEPRKLLKALKLTEGMMVADVGAGTGYFTFPIATQIGDKGKVYAVEIQNEMLAMIRQKARAGGFKNVLTVKGTVTDPKLPPGAIDLILLVDVYHEFSHPFEMTEAMVRALKPGGRLCFVEYRAEDPEVPIKPLHKMTEKQVKKEMEPHPVRFVDTLDVLPRQHIIFFEKEAKPEP
jgi:precorrin-6B methylase 2